ncbi:glycerophosphoryl diester phosphodiesterase [Corynebacterium suranareeae]|uniref:Glycerophosphoryl diester phosphodiesterase n=1 Tax=Corynebacterium suranareeae TaxID=2506452 RepID=A0A160PTC7_9CORY|nr:glycerophosphodiester phosphodiesterase [Corynebacterium suranareeae]BAU95740.1 glycerophosphoryl diester phosphodiesterase [Corynebacterium suranareeae]
MHIVAHRGAEDLHLENTMAAFHAASPADAFELDIHASADNHAIVIHDRTAARVAAPHSPHRDTPVARLSAAQIKDITLIDGSPVPTLEEVLLQTDLPIQVEIKSAGAVPAAAALLQKYPSHLERLLFISFIDAALVEIVDRLPNARVGILRDASMDDLSIIDYLGAERVGAVLPSWKALNLATIADLQTKGIKVGCWTIRDENAFGIAQQAGVDYATVSDPTRFLAPSPTEKLRW